MFINNQMINPFTYEEQELINISTGHKSTFADLINTHEKESSPQKTFAAKAKKVTVHGNQS